MSHHKEFSAVGITEIAITGWRGPVDRKISAGTINIDTDAKVGNVEITQKGRTLWVKFPPNTLPGPHRLTIHAPESIQVRLV